MNLTDAADIKINGKEVQQIKIDGNIVYTAGYRIRITTDKTYILTGETATLTVKCEDLPFTQIELYNVIDMVQTKIADLTTDSNGQATYTYTGDGSGEIGFLAKYDEKESNMVIIDDYIPVYHPVLSNWPTTITYGHANRGLVVAAKDQHDEKANGVTIVFKEGDTVLDTIVTAGSTPGTMGTATLDLNSLGVGVHTIYAVIGSTSSTLTATITVNKANTSLAISVPALVYSDNFSVTGVLKDSYNTPISGATVRLKWNIGNNEYSATAITNASGEVTFATQAPTSITDYTFQLEFDGNANYNSSTSSVVEKTVGKETTILNLTTPSTSSVTCDGTLSIAGTLLTDDGELVDDVSVWLSENGYNSQYFYVEDGEFSGTITGLSAGTHTLRFDFYGSDSTLYNGSYKEITVNVVQYDGLADLELIAGNQILSYADEQQTPGSQYATLETQLMNGDSPAAIEGVEVGFWDFTDSSSPVLLDSDTTDSNGQASFTYYSQGVGDVPIKAVVGSFVSETCTVEDIYKYDPCTSDRTANYSGNGSLSFDTDHYIFTGGGSRVIADNLSNFKFEAKMRLIEKSGCLSLRDTSNNYQIKIYNWVQWNKTGFGKQTNNWTPINEVNTIVNNTDDYILSITYNNGTVSAEIKTLSGTSVYSRSASFSMSSGHIQAMVQILDTSKTLHLKEMKIREL